MEIEKYIKIELSENYVKEIIADYLNKEGCKVEVNDIDFVVGSRIRGYGIHEYEEYYFKEANVYCKEK